MARRQTRKTSSATITARAVLLLVVVLIGAYLIDRYVTPIPLPRVVVATPVPPSPAAGSAGSGVEVFFTTPSLVYPDRAASRQPPPIEQAIIADIDGAKSSVEFATFEYNLISIADALARAKGRGVDVRAALDRENLDKVEMADFAAQLQRAQIPISWEETDAFLHSKFIIVDRSLVWMGSWNSTVNDTYRNNNNLLRITVPQIVENYTAEFAQMVEGSFGRSKESVTPNPRVSLGSVVIENYFSPEDGVRKHIVEKIDNASKSIRVLAFSFTADAIKTALVERSAAGVKVSGVFEQRNLTGQGGEFNALQGAGIDVLSDGNCYTMHHKLMVIDDRIVITGSYNFTSRAENDNDENLVIIDDPVLAQQYIAEFDRVYQQAQNPTRCG
jgi:phosphatidylserine/phosphatidylglycerophosphate/cardiolipin synthase-like enzyme